MKRDISICIAVFCTILSYILKLKTKKITNYFSRYIFTTFIHGQIYHPIYNSYNLQNVIFFSYSLCVRIDGNSLFFNISTIIIIEIKHFFKLQTVFQYIKYYFFDQQQIWSDSCPVRNVDNFSLKNDPCELFLSSDIFVQVSMNTYHAILTLRSFCVRQEQNRALRTRQMDKIFVPFATLTIPH